MFLLVPAPAADATAVNPTGIKTHLANGLSTFFINGKPNLINGPRGLPRNPPDSNFLDSWIFDNFVLAMENYVEN